MRTDKERKLEEILNSLDGIRRAEAPDFFYTRLKARMERGWDTPQPVAKKLFPAYALAAVILLMLINVFLLLTRNHTTAGDPVASGESETLQSLAADNNINDVSGIFDLNDVR